MSFVLVREFNKWKARVTELQARVQALETFHQNEPEVAEAEKKAEPIPNIEEAIEEEDLTVDEDPGPSLYSILGSKIAELLVADGLDSVYKVEAASDERLQSVNGIGAATVRSIREAL
jgi:hypothetical protein